MWNVISLAAILNFIVTSERPGTKEYWEVWEFTICTSPIIHIVCPPPPSAPQNFANAFSSRCFQQNIFRTFMGSINSESILGSLFFFFNNLYAKISSKLHLIHRWNISFKPLDWSLTNFSAKFPHKFCNSPTLLFTEIIIWNEKDTVKYGDSPDRSLARSSRCWKLREAPKKLHRHWTGLTAN